MNFSKLLKGNIDIESQINNEITYESQPVFDITPVQFKKGDTICVIKYQDNIMNQYKGYTGTIRDSLIGSDECLVVLDAVTASPVMKFNKKNLIRWCPYESIEI